MNNTKIVANHYNAIQERGIDARKESRIYYMRSFNNWIKSMLISTTITKLQKKDLKVLDMCCGKGGDIQKWVKSNAVDHVVFADIAETSVEQCKERYKSLRGHTFSAEFITLDCTKDSLKERYEDPDIKFDLVSVQFSFHYCFESFGQVEKMLSNISQNLAKNGYFIGTTLNANRIVKQLRASKEMQFGNEVFNIKFECQEPIPIFGAKYLFNLEEVVNCPEFLVHFHVFERIATKYSLKLLYKHPFDVFFEMHKDEGKFLLERMQALKTLNTDKEHDPEYDHASNCTAKCGTLSKSEWETACLYLVFCFVKI